MKITGSLIVCSLAAAFTATALLADPAPIPVAPPPLAAPPIGSTGQPAPVLAIQGFAFSAVAATTGAIVTVSNADEVEHSATSADGSFDSGIVGAGASGSFIAPLVPGVYPIVCVIHPSMTGSITVA